MSRPEGSPMDIETLYREQPRPLVRETFEAWLVRDLKWHDAVPLLLGDADSFDDAVRLGEQGTGHKGTFFVLRTDCETGKAVQSFYAVRQKAKALYRRAAEDMAHVVQFRPMYSQHLFDLTPSGFLTGVVEMARRAIL